MGMVPTRKDEEMTDKPEVGTEEWARSISHPYTAIIWNTPHNPAYCCATIWGPRVTSWQCNRKPSVFYGSLGYCKQHDPAAQIARRAEQDKRLREQMETDARKYALRALGPKAIEALRQIAAGHNDPRSLAKEVLDTFDSKYPQKEAAE